LRISGIWSVVISAVAGCSAGPPADEPVGSRLSEVRDHHRIDDLIAAMTLDEKIGLLIGNPIAGPPDPLGLAGAGYVPGVPRLGIPPLRFSDGPAGIRTPLPTTALPAPVVLAASFSRDLAAAYGSVLGAESQARQQDVLFGPMVNLVRVPVAGRNFETLGEDPFLQRALIAPEVESVQRAGTIVTIKHFAENNQENNRMAVDVHVDPQTLHELELPAFESAVAAGAGAVMCAYNKVNGAFSCENPELLATTLRGRWGFDGFVLSDFGANHSTTAALTAGLDLEFLSTFFSGLGIIGGDPTTAIKFQIEHGLLDAGVVDRAVRHILTSMAAFHLLDGASPTGAPVVDHPRPPLDPAGDADIAEQVARAGAVLLKNDRDLLPLAPRDLRSLAVIGPTAKAPLLGGGGSARVVPFPGVRSPLDALVARAGSSGGIVYQAGIELDGVAVPASALSPTNPAGAPGLTRTVSPGGATQIDPQIDFTGTAALAPAAPGTVTWTGFLTAPATGDYELKVQALAVATGGSAGFSARLVVDGTPLASTGGIFPVNGSLIPTADGLASAGATLHLEAGAPHAIAVTVNLSPTAPTQIRLAWITPERRAATFAAAVEAARAAPTAVVFAHNEGTEGSDRAALAMPRGQDALIAAVAAVNPRTIVVLNTGDPVTMPWVGQVPAILEMWYPGQRVGEATAALLLGDASPSGKLPVTFPVRIEDNPTFSADGSRYPGVNNEEFYAEGIFAGYRWYDAHAIQPLFPFGHGLSYSRFRYADLEIRDRGDGFDATFVVQNIGRRRAAEVAQVYLGPPRRSPAPIAVRALVGFARLDLAPGQTERITVHVGRRERSYWSVERNDWVVAPGTRPLFVGSSSRDLRLRGEARGDD
jgi:beta-glucosidase